MDIHELTVDFGSIATAAGSAAVIAWGLVKALLKAHAEKLNEIAGMASKSASKDDLTKLETRMNAVENRYHDEIRDLRSEMNGLGQRLENALNAKLEPIQSMVQQLVTSLLNGKDR